MAECTNAMSYSLIIICLGALSQATLQDDDMVQCGYVQCDLQIQWCDDVTGDCGFCNIPCEHVTEGTSMAQFCWLKCKPYMDRLTATTTNTTGRSETTSAVPVGHPESLKSKISVQIALSIVIIVLVMTLIAFVVTSTTVLIRKLSKHEDKRPEKEHIVDVNSDVEKQCTQQNFQNIALIAVPHPCNDPPSDKNSVMCPRDMHPTGVF